MCLYYTLPGRNCQQKKARLPRHQGRLQTISCRLKIFLDKPALPAYNIDISYRLDRNKSTDEPAISY
ncbi:MAG: hypothetical protein MR821_08850, partial [Clostridiales bacterium]|nr:hypothetical protein [Clostridiales bacterium]